MAAKQPTAVQLRGGRQPRPPCQVQIQRQSIHDNLSDPRWRGLPQHMAPPSRKRSAARGPACGRPVAVYHQHRLVPITGQDGPPPSHVARVGAGRGGGSAVSPQWVAVVTLPRCSQRGPPTARASARHCCEPTAIRATRKQVQVETIVQGRSVPNAPRPRGPIRVTPSSLVGTEAARPCG